MLQVLEQGSPSGHFTGHEDSGPCLSHQAEEISYSSDQAENTLHGQLLMTPAGLGSSSRLVTLPILQLGRLRQRLPADFLLMDR